MHDEMKKVDLTDVCQIEKDLISALKTVISHGVFSKDVNKDELGGLVDMVKDMAETKRNCWEAQYYKTVTEAMEKGGEESYEENGRGINPNCIPTHMIRKHITGYTPFNPNMDDGFDFVDYHNGMKDRNNNDHYDNWNDEARNQKHHKNQYGDAFGEYEDARRHYTETKSLEDRNHMNEKAMEHVEHSMMTLRDIWKNADPTIRKEVSSAISSLASEFKNV